MATITAHVPRHLAGESEETDSYSDASPGILRAIGSLLGTCSLMYKIPTNLR